MNIVVRLEKQEIIYQNDVLEAIGLGVFSELYYLQNQEKWKKTLENWRQSNSRKIVRRAKRSAWDKARELCEKSQGKYIKNKNIEILVFPPCDETPGDVKKLQVSGLQLKEKPCAAEIGGEKVDRNTNSENPKTRQTNPTIRIALTKTPQLSTGKLGAQDRKSVV